MADDALTRDLATILESITAVEDRGVDPATPIQGDNQTFTGLTSGVVRPNHARAGVESPDSVVWFEFEEMRMFVAAKLIDTSGGEFVLLILGGEFEDREVITGGFRLYVDDGSSSDLANDARAAFQRFVEQHALPYEPDGGQTLFRPVVRGPMTGPPMETLIGLLGLDMEPDASWMAVGSMQHDGETVTMAFPFVLDTTNYLAFVREHGWGG